MSYLNSWLLLPSYGISTFAQFLIFSLLFFWLHYFTCFTYHTFYVLKLIGITSVYEAYSGAQDYRQMFH